MSLQSYRGIAPGPRGPHSEVRQDKGFTLIEVTLGIVVGALVIAGATLLFRSAQLSVQNSQAKQKVEAFKTTVEELAQRMGGQYPTLAQLRQVWQTRRPSDYNMSPWGQPIQGADGTNVGVRGNDAVAGGTFLGTGEAGDAAADAGASDIGMIYYYRASDKNPFYMLDLTIGDTVQVKDFGVGITTADGKRYHHVTGNQRKTGLSPVDGSIAD